MMKKNFKHAVAFTLLIGFIVLAIGSAASPRTVENPSVEEQPDYLDTAIRETSDYLNKNINAGNKLAILNIQSDYPVLSEYVIDELIANAVNDKIFSVVDRQQLDTIRAELDFHMSGEVDDASAQALGQMLGAQTIISGGITKVGDMYRLRVRALGVQNAQIEGQFNKNIPSGYTINMLVQSSSAGGGSVASSQTTTSRQTQAINDATTETASTPATPESASTVTLTPVVPAVRAYRIGDTGPAGGLIFYDKGNNSGGWRYLEAAPEEAEFQTRWSMRNTAVDNTRDGIGNGRRNTQLIVEKFKQTSGEWDTAAQKADELIYNGFDDWFLPSQSELDQIYGNLKRINLGDFKNGRYWSSTESSSSQRNLAFLQNFSDGRLYSVDKSNSYYVRPIRQVPGP